MSSRRFYLACATIAAAAIGSIAWAEYAEAQETPGCGPTNEMLADLRKSGQTEVAVGAVTGQVLFVFYASPGGKQWTQISIRVDGQACILAKGTYWSAAPIIPEGQPV